MRRICNNRNKFIDIFFLMTHQFILIHLQGEPGEAGNPGPPGESGTSVSILVLYY